MAFYSPSPSIAALLPKVAEFPQLEIVESNGVGYVKPRGVDWCAFVSRSVNHATRELLRAGYYPLDNLRTQWARPAVDVAWLKASLGPLERIARDATRALWFVESSDSQWAQLAVAVREGNRGMQCALLELLAEGE